MNKKHFGSFYSTILLRNHPLLSAIVEAGVFIEAIYCQNMSKVINSNKFI